jgi:hypothetical protein
MSLNLTDDEIHGLIAYARSKFAAERYPCSDGAARSASPGQGPPEAEARALAATKTVCAEPSAGQEEQATALSGAGVCQLVATASAAPRSAPLAVIL